ncbi:hypothetical protein A2U01_0066348, partial [Trifolium medium]|nr:hypothetical protein [Trifolium medium]
MEDLLLSLAHGTESLARGAETVELWKICFCCWRAAQGVLARRARLRRKWSRELCFWRVAQDHM